MEMLHELVIAKYEDSQENRPPCLIGGNLNITGRALLYEEWIQKEGILELVSPDIPTYATGSALDKLLLTPGAYIPHTFLPPRCLRTAENKGVDED